MYKNILLGTDGSPAAGVAANYAIWFAHKLGARLAVLYVTDIRLLEGPLLADLSGALGAQPYPGLLPQVQEIQRVKADMILRGVAKKAAAKGVACNVTHETGNLVQTILAQEQQADVVVLGQHGEHAPWSGGHLGSSVERVVRASVKPCLVTPEKFREIDHLLLAHDGSAESHKALRAGLQLAVNLGARVTVITVCQREHEETASQFLQEAHEQALASKLTCDAQLLCGIPEKEILEFAGKTEADLIVMGAYGHTRIRELILGSTTSHVIRKAPVPVLLVRG
jgi:nucleotide-binding universal stress UspA family protein